MGCPSITLWHGGTLTVPIRHQVSHMDIICPILGEIELGRWDMLCPSETVNVLVGQSMSHHVKSL